MPIVVCQAILSRVAGHRLARLVHQGCDPTLPHEALVTRESAKLREGHGFPVLGGVRPRLQHAALPVQQEKDPGAVGDRLLLGGGVETPGSSPRTRTPGADPPSCSPREEPRGPSTSGGTGRGNGSWAWAVSPPQSAARMMAYRFMRTPAEWGQDTDDGHHLVLFANG